MALHMFLEVCNECSIVVAIEVAAKRVSTMIAPVSAETAKTLGGQSLRWTTAVATVPVEAAITSIP